MSDTPSDRAGEPAGDPRLPAAEVTRLIAQVRAGDAGAEGALFESLYDELREIAGRMFASQKPSHTLQPTALLHEAYLKIARPSELEVSDRSHFLNLAARAMRQILVNHARDRVAQKRGGPERQRVPLPDSLADGAGLDSFEVLSLDEALSSLAEVDPRQAEIVQLRIFAGLSHEEVAESLGVSLRTVEGDWKMAKAWLRVRLDDGSEEPS